LLTVVGLGYGVFATRFFPRGSFLLNYHGELLSASDAESRDDHMDYIYFFSSGGQAYA